MSTGQVNFEGRLLPNEERNLLNVLDRLGYIVARDIDSGIINATRPEVLTKPEFVSAVELSDLDSAFYGGVAWGALQEFAKNRSYYNDRGQTGYKNFEDFPAEFIVGSWSTRYMRNPNLLVASTLPPSAAWVREHVGHDRVTDRLATALEAVQAALPRIVEQH